ncbi:tRNA-(ms[2]io[6]A)-hydroxylase [Nonlabens ulvanivorans]|nr:tRNA isopentenyl-2-thiomethyl-A-37 hydroxylase MiaE [Nonlabens ulvanivorans]GAK91653.1 tRNA-(ms[2]io[6]A)-hydroxylase [Nonlabens ulvanivorans]
MTEEWGHFRMVIAMLKKRGLELGLQRQDEYVKKLVKGKKKGQSRDGYFLDQLLICAMIEARSCERFKTLWQNLDDEELQEFYYKFMVAEASHYKLFLQLAKTHFPEDEVIERWNYWLDYEASFIGDLEVRGDRLH